MVFEPEMVVASGVVICDGESVVVVEGEISSFGKDLMMRFRSESLGEREIEEDIALFCWEGNTPVDLDMDLYNRLGEYFSDSLPNCDGGDEESGLV